MSTFMKLDFEGRPFTTLRHLGRPCWIAREVGTLLGYAQAGLRLAMKVNGSEKFVEGKDYCVVRGQDLEQFRSLAQPGTESVPGRASSVMLLFESGMYLVLNGTNKAAGRRLRRFLIDEVLPQIARDGRYGPQREAASVLTQTADDWVSPTAISQRTGVAVQGVSRAISELGLRGNRAGLCRTIVTKGKGDDRSVTSFLYSPRAVAQIEAVLAHSPSHGRRLGTNGSALEAG